MPFYNGTETFNLVDGSACIRRKDPFSGKWNEITVHLDRAQFNAWVSGELAQRAFPHLTADQREFIMTGITSDEWDKAFKDQG